MLERARGRHRSAARRQHERRRDLPDARQLSESANVPDARGAADRPGARAGARRVRWACRRCARAAISHGRSRSSGTFPARGWLPPRRCAWRTPRIIRTASATRVSDWAARACGRANSTPRSACSRAASRRARTFRCCARRLPPTSGSRMRAAAASPKACRISMRRSKARRRWDGSAGFRCCSPSAARSTCSPASRTRRSASRRRRCALRPSRRSAATRSMRRTSSPGLPRSAAASAEAERHYLDALALATELGMRPLSAHCHAGLARLYARDGQRGEGGRALDERAVHVPRNGDVVLGRAARKGRLARPRLVHAAGLCIAVSLRIR